MNLPDAIKSGFRQYVGFSGRARRSEYWFWALFAFIVGVVASILDSALGIKSSSTGSGPIEALAGLALLLPGLSIFWRRMHDIGRSGAWFFCLLIPIAQFVFAIIYIVWFCKDSEPGDNRFGPNPKGIGGFGGGYGGPSPYGQQQYGQQYGQPGPYGQQPGQPGQYGQPGEGGQQPGQF